MVGVTIGLLHGVVRVSQLPKPPFAFVLDEVVVTGPGATIVLVAEPSGL